MRMINLLTFRSLTQRLTLIYTLSAFFVLAFATLVLYGVLAHHLERENVKFLENKIVILQKILQTQPTNIQTNPTLRQETIIEPPVTRTFYRILDSAHKVLIETPGMSRIIPIDAFADILPGAKHTYKVHYREDGHKVHAYYLLMQAQVIQPSHKPSFFIQVAKNSTTDHEILEDYRTSLIFVLLVGIIGLIAIGYVVIRKGLKPLRDMTTSTQRISINQLQERLNPASWPTELSKLAIAFNNMLDRIEEGFARLSQFSDDLAHELRTPVTILRGEAEIALSKPRTVEEYRKILESSLEEFDQISLMIEKLLFLARVENPNETVNYSQIDIHQLFEDIYEVYEGIAEIQKVNLSYQGDGVVKADLMMIRRAMNNLISNALKHTLQGGSIHLQAKINEIDQTCQITVSDTGSGIPAEHLPHLFDRFYRVDSSRSQNTGGTGLGLAIVKSIMNLHHGKVVVSSEMGKGTQVTLMFPV